MPPLEHQQELLLLLIQMPVNPKLVSATDLDTGQTKTCEECRHWYFSRNCYCCLSRCRPNQNLLVPLTLIQAKLRLAKNAVIGTSAGTTIVVDTDAGQTKTFYIISAMPVKPRHSILSQ
jgi:hypothetical protein